MFHDPFSPGAFARPASVSSRFFLPFPCPPTYDTPWCGWPSPQRPSPNGHGSPPRRGKSPGQSGGKNKGKHPKGRASLPLPILLILCTSLCCSTPRQNLPCSTRYYGHSRGKKKPNTHSIFKPNFPTAWLPGGGKQTRAGDPGEAPTAHASAREKTGNGLQGNETWFSDIKPPARPLRAI